MLRNLLEVEASSITNEMETKLRSQIIIWTSKGLVFVLYFILMALVGMANPESSILYSKYDKTRVEHIS